MSIFEEMERDAAKFRRAPTAEESTRLTALGLELVSIDERLAEYKAVAKELLERKQQIQMRDMVDLMDEIGQDKIGLPDQKVDLVLDDYFKAGLPSASEGDDNYDEKMELRRRGVEWLRENEPGLLSTTVVVTLPRGCLAQANEIRNMLVSEQGYGIDPSRVAVDESVHWATLTSFVKEQVREKKVTDLPLEILGATVGRIVKIVKRKKDRK